MTLVIAFASAVAFAQPVIGPAGQLVNPGILGDAFQVNYLPVAAGPTATSTNGVVNITSTGALGADVFSFFPTGTGKICANVYVFTPDEQEVACCSCLVTPNAGVHATAFDLTGNTITGIVPGQGVVVKLLATIPGKTAALPGMNNQLSFTGSVCPSPGYPYSGLNLAPGMRAWEVSAHTVGTVTGVSKTEFSPAPLSTGELTRMTSLCSFIVGNGSGFGICRGCSPGLQ